MAMIMKVPKRDRGITRAEMIVAAKLPKNIKITSTDSKTAKSKSSIVPCRAARIYSAWVSAKIILTSGSFCAMSLTSFSATAARSRLLAAPFLITCTAIASWPLKRTSVGNGRVKLLWGLSSLTVP